MNATKKDPRPPQTSATETQLSGCCTPAGWQSCCGTGDTGDCCTGNGGTCCGQSATR